MPLFLASHHTTEAISTSYFYPTKASPLTTHIARLIYVCFTGHVRVKTATLTDLITNDTLDYSLGSIFVRGVNVCNYFNHPFNRSFLHSPGIS